MWYWRLHRANHGQLVAPTGRDCDAGWSRRSSQSSWTKFPNFPTDLKHQGARSWYTIDVYIHLSSSPVVKGVASKPSIKINQPMGIWDIYGLQIILQQPIQ